MNNFLSSIAENASNLPNALFVTAFGLAGVFIVLAVFFFLIVVLERVFRPKKDGPEKAQSVS